MRLCTYWREHPPLHVLLAGYVGYKPSKRTPEIASGDMAQLTRMLGPAAQPPERVKELMRWAEQMSAKMGKA